MKNCNFCEPEPCKGKEATIIDEVNILNEYRNMVFQLIQYVKQNPQAVDGNYIQGVKECVELVDFSLIIKESSEDSNKVCGVVNCEICK